eukprot:954373-Pelagomonas_calceolata.AAC.4
MMNAFAETNTSIDMRKPVLNPGQAWTNAVFVHAAKACTETAIFNVWGAVPEETCKAFDSNSNLRHSRNCQMD